MNAPSNLPSQSNTLLFRLIMGAVGLGVLLCLLFILIGPSLLDERGGDFDYIPPTRDRTLLAQLTKTTAIPPTIEVKTEIPSSPTPHATETTQTLTPTLVIESVGSTATFTYLPPTRVSPSPTATLVPTNTVLPTMTATVTASVTASIMPSRVPRASHTPRPSATASDSPTPIFTMTASPSMVASPSATKKPSNTPSPTQSPSVTAIASPSPTPIASVTSSRTPSPTATIEPSSTVLFPTGRELHLFYDANSFYVANPNSTPIEISLLTFEALNSGGDLTGQRFSGNTWAQIYGVVEPNGCVAIEIFGAGTALEPPICVFYNATINPPGTSSTIFWVTQPTFIVFWNNQEIARCEITAGECHIFVP